MGSVSEKIKILGKSRKDHARDFRKMTATKKPSNRNAGPWALQQTDVAEDSTSELEGIQENPPQLESRE